MDCPLSWQQCGKGTGYYSGIPNCKAVPDLLFVVRAEQAKIKNGKKEEVDMAEIKRLLQSKAIVTGAAQGIGEAIARVLAREGASVVLADINLKGAKAVSAEIERSGATAWPLQVDVTRQQEVTAMIRQVQERWGPVDILVNNAGGFFRFSSILEVPEEEWDRIMTLNIKSTFLCSQAVAKPMMERKKGRIINIASMAGLGPNPHAPTYLPYGCAKAAVIAFTKHLARELGPYGITVNTISPSTAATPRVKRVRDAASLEKIASMNPLGRLVEPEDVAEAALFLASAEARNITGINLNVNAGTVMV
jgi:3-oxoacyl-[acyl-carrier protein] reductase